MAKINKHDKADKKHYITANTILNLAQRAKEIFESSEPQEKRQLLNFLLQNLELKDKNLQYKLKTPFDTVLSTSKCSNLLPGSPACSPRKAPTKRAGRQGFTPLPDTACKQAGLQGINSCPPKPLA